MDTYSLAPPEPTDEDRRTAELIKGVKDNPYLGTTREGKPGHKPRPTRDDSRYSHDRDDTRLRTDQARWDAAEKWAQHNDDLKAARIAKRDADRDAERQRQQAAADERTAKARGELEGRLRLQFLQTPGATAADWERNKERILDRHFEEAAFANDETARRSHATMYRG